MSRYLMDRITDQADIEIRYHSGPGHRGLAGIQA
jgi:hypothetical protein